MLVAVSGTKFSGADVLVDLLAGEFGFERLDAAVGVDEILRYFTLNYARDLVVPCESLVLCNALERRPFFVHISVDAPVSLRIARCGNGDVSKLIAMLDEHDFCGDGIALREKAQFKYRVVATQPDSSPETLQRRLNAAMREQLSVLRNAKLSSPLELNPPLRPDWDTYFMKLATLAASRSNCMKRRVGCVIVRECRVIATGYNGTPRHLTNCFNGGCPRCNGGGSDNLHTCLCLHAEENALLEAGRDRVGDNATLYCDTCPCLTCSVKIVQTGIKEVVYSQSYRMDEHSFKVLKEGGVLVRQFSFLQEPVIVEV
ncbi:deoxycytidine monophosphate deaminase KNAG_0H03810 [Huiozyma naganishii CBS 8797]|uniref:Deoxycytidylate deaminase n=1 Tax=Huiozyma naganishii (strain ATCC MYA-139 / BCRC 22969 / CBS 8797 / KCTC 17520 / NBRC 10181 / NCYC 3082 / Yp74L-3) TaxID=1071383 RepID=J7RA93_HUIN7|nr:hypothetical protein KNAG_0H03810 [Kazachstania naganishii CBS 8797]CCK71795.1 hypothetical protein KNAG_0H03810 [Kazachstania naganishii CBS 8797]